MASCINTLKDRPAMYGTPLPASPRISFSNDLAAEPRPPPRDIVTPDPTFEFAVGVRPMIAADELFFKGRMLPLSSGQLARVTTLREELRAEGVPQPKGLVRWKEFLGLKRLNSGHPPPRNGKSVNSSATTDAAGDKCRKIQSGVRDVWREEVVVFIWLGFLLVSVVIVHEYKRNCSWKH